MNLFQFSRFKFYILIAFIGFQYSVNANNLNSNIKINHIEPPSWWAGMENKNLQLMLHGNNISELKVKVNNKHWQIKTTHKTNNKNYLFIDLVIPSNTPSGIYNLNLVKNNNVVYTINYELKKRQENSKLRQGFNSSDVIYLVTPDRFANGNYENDEVKELKEGVKRDDPDGRHGGDLQGVIDHLDYISEMGFTQIWLNPVLENNQSRTSYHGYSTTDYYQVDQRMGDNALYKKLSKKAKQKNIGLLKDVILNHIGSEHWWMKDLPSKDWINHDAKFVSTNHRRETLFDPHAATEDKEAFVSGWFVPSMPDLNQANQLLANYLIQNSIWWIEYADLSGIRLDTYSYSNRDFLSEYTRRIMQEYPHFNLVGEEWSYNPNIIAYWQRGKNRHDNYQSNLPTLMDFPLHDAFVKSMLEEETWKDGLLKLYAALGNDFIYFAPEKLVVFPDNHDMSRIYTQLNHDVELTKIAIAYFATTRGTPQFFYGTEILMDNKQSDAHGIIRADFPGGWKADEQDAFVAKNLTEKQNGMQSFVKALLNWRKKSPVIHNGKLTHYAPVNGVYVYFRYNQTDKVMVVINKNNKMIEIDPTQYSSMLNDKSKNNAKDIFSNKKYDLNNKFKVNKKSILILDFN